MDQKTLEKAQMLQQQLQAVMVQKESLKMQLNEAENALKELGKTKEGAVYKITGPLLLKVDKAHVTDELEERKKFISLKVNTLERSEKRLTDELSELGKAIDGSAGGKKEIKVGG